MDLCATLDWDPRNTSLFTMEGYIDPDQWIEEGNKYPNFWDYEDCRELEEILDGHVKQKEEMVATKALELLNAHLVLTRIEASLKRFLAIYTYTLAPPFFETQTKKMVNSGNTLRYNCYNTKNK